MHKYWRKSFLQKGNNIPQIDPIDSCFPWLSCNDPNPYGHSSINMRVTPSIFYLEWLLHYITKTTIPLYNPLHAFHLASLWWFNLLVVLKMVKAERNYYTLSRLGSSDKNYGVSALHPPLLVMQSSVIQLAATIWLEQFSRPDFCFSTHRNRAARFLKKPNGTVSGEQNDFNTESLLTSHSIFIPSIDFLRIVHMYWNTFIESPRHSK